MSDGIQTLVWRIEENIGLQNEAGRPNSHFPMPSCTTTQLSFPNALSKNNESITTLQKHFFKTISTP
jgi:hypothetical protein